MSLLHFTTSNKGKVSINTEYIVLVYPHPETLLKSEEYQLTVISDVSGSRSVVEGTYEAILGYIRDAAR